MKQPDFLRVALSMALLISGLLLTQPGSAAQISPLPPVLEADGTLGLCYAFYDDAWMQLAYAAGARGDRFDFRWNAVEIAPGIYDFSGHEAILARYAALGIPMEVIGILGSPALWAADCPAVIQQTPQFSVIGHLRNDLVGWRACLPKGLYLPWDHPENLWGRYVETVVSHFQGQVSLWEMWNEPDLTSFWLGSPQDYAQLLKVGYRAAKHANPDAVVLFGGLAYWGNPRFYSEALAHLAADPSAAAHNAYFDVMSLHLYSNVYQAHDIAAEVRATMEALVGPHPLWLTEAGVPIWNEDPPPPDPTIPWPPPYTATAAEAAAYVIEAYAGARAAGVERFFIFRLHDDHAGMGERYGITRDDHALRPAYVAYQVAARYLRDAEEVIGPFRGHTHRISFLSSVHGRTDVVWNPAPTPRTLLQPALKPMLTIITQEGLTSVVTATETYTLPLGPATANQNPQGQYMIGGPPLLLAFGHFDDLTPPTSALDALPTRTLAADLALTWSVADTGTGYWYTEIEAARAPDGPWRRIAGAAQTEGRTRFVPGGLSGLPESGLWYFRARARDQAGNWEEWPLTAEVSTTLRVGRVVTLTASAFSDINGNGQKDEGEPDLENATIVWRTASGSEIDRSTGGVWQITREVPFGTYELLFFHAEHLTARYAFIIETSLEPLTLERREALRPIRGRVFLPLVRRN